MGTIVRSQRTGMSPQVMVAPLACARSWESPKARQRQQNLEQRQHQRRRDQHRVELGVVRRLRLQLTPVEVLENRLEPLLERLVVRRQKRHAAGGLGDLLEELRVDRIL